MLLWLAPRSATGAVVPTTAVWQSCPEQGPAVECTSLVVPLDHVDPASAMVRLAVRRVAAAEPEGHLGVLVVIAGGPGQRGTDLVRPGMHTPALHDRFDIVSWDPRGTSGETHIDCIPRWDPYADLDRTPDTAAEERLLDTRTVELADRCRDAHGPTLPFLGTVDSVFDLESLRELVGAERISLLASSYGTRIAVLYATLFPEHIRAIVLDGHSDPTLTPDELEVVQATAFERELDRVLAACASDVTCSFHSGGDPHGALDRLLERLDAAPIPTAGDGRPAREADAHEAILGSLVLGGQARSRLLAALAAADSGDGGPIRHIADGIRSSFESSGLDMGTFMATYCADTAAYWRGTAPEDVARLTSRILEVAPRLGPWLWSPPARADLPPVGLCAMTPPGPPRPRPQADAAGSGPILVLATTGDPTTPIEEARRASRQLEDATLVELRADHHLAYVIAASDPERPAHRCVLDAVEAYLIDLVARAEGAVCR
jgi:pimeloyl-ACP methyl ester carboxylesterase